MDQWGVWQASPTPLTRFIGLSPLRQMHARPHIEPYRFAALKRAAVGSQVSLRSIKTKGWDGSVRSKIAEGHFVQGMQHPRIFCWGHIGRGWTNIAPIFVAVWKTRHQRKRRHGMCERPLNIHRMCTSHFRRWQVYVETPEDALPLSTYIIHCHPLVHPPPQHSSADDSLRHHLWKVW
jgi:hypothetical protein